jgi:hypothetical protein
MGMGAERNPVYILSFPLEDFQAIVGIDDREDNLIPAAMLGGLLPYWCDENNEHGVSERFFGLRLKEMGFEQGRTSEARYWRPGSAGVGIASSAHCGIPGYLPAFPPCRIIFLHCLT